MREEYMPKLPKDIADYPSGHLLRDVYKGLLWSFTFTRLNIAYAALQCLCKLYFIIQSNIYFFLSNSTFKLTVGTNDKDELLKQMPKDYWLREGPTKCLLACMMQEIATTCSSLPAGQSREMQRENAAARVAAEHAAAKKAQKRQDDDKH